jgi:glc operon protein GlcG
MEAEWEMAIKLADANRAIEAVQAKASSLALDVSTAVCDADGRLVAFQRMDGALGEANRASIEKALASVQSGRPSWDQSIESPNYRAATVIGEGISPLRRPGGLPIIRAGQIEGALGVAGACSDEQNEECALAGIVALQEEAYASKA